MYNRQDDCQDMLQCFGLELYSEQNMFLEAQRFGGVNQSVYVIFFYRPPPPPRFATPAAVQDLVSILLLARSLAGLLRTCGMCLLAPASSADGVSIACARDAAMCAMLSHMPLFMTTRHTSSASRGPCRVDCKGTPHNAPGRSDTGASWHMTVVEHLLPRLHLLTMCPCTCLQPSANPSSVTTPKVRPYSMEPIRMYTAGAGSGQAGQTLNPL